MKKKKELYNVDGNVINILEKNMTLLSDDDKKKIAFFIDLGMKINFLKEPPKKKKNAFTAENAISYIKANETREKAKEIIKDFEDLKNKANELTNDYMETNNELKNIKEQKRLFKALKNELEAKEKDENKIVEITNELIKLDETIKELDINDLKVIESNIDKANITANELEKKVKEKRTIQLEAQLSALKEQRKYFKEMYGEEEYKLVVSMKNE